MYPQSTARPTVKLVGADGNAFAILGRGIRAAKAAGWSHEELEEFKTDAMAGDYAHLLHAVIDRFDEEEA